MPNISEYLSELVTQKSSLAANLVTKGVSASDSETLNTLVPKVLLIPSGSGITPTGTINISENGTVDVTNYASATVEVSGASIDPDHMYYNGYLLPTIPEINGYSYVWIRKNTQTSYFDALYGRSTWYSDQSASTFSADNWMIKTATMPDYKHYRVPITNASSSTWEEVTGTSYSTMGTDNGRDIIWTNQDILFNSPTASAIILIKGFPVAHYV